MNNKQTALRSLLSELQRRFDLIQSEPDGMVRETMIDNFLLDTETYLEMEKQQMFEFWNGGIDCTEEKGKSFEQYYKETYGE
jgi:hypothetical protein